MLLKNILEEESGNPELITHGDTLGGSNLELPLSGHDLGVGSRDVNAGVQAASVLANVSRDWASWRPRKDDHIPCLVVSLDNVTLNDLASANTAVVRTPFNHPC